MSMLDAACCMTMSDDDADWGSAWNEDDSWGSGQQLSSVRQDEEPPWQVVKSQAQSNWKWPQYGGGFGGFYSMQRNLGDMTPDKLGRQKAHVHKSVSLNIGMQENQ